MKKLKRRLACLLLAVLSSLSGCDASPPVEQKTAVSYLAFNHTGQSIVSIIVNGEGGVLHAPAYDGGGEVCCVMLPAQWRPGLQVAIRWKESGDFKRDEKGAIVRNDGVPVVIERPYKEKTVEVPKYEGSPDAGQFRVHFFPNDEVKVTVLPYGPGHEGYPYPPPMEPSGPTPSIR
jgi:hypothetical protein